MHTENFLAAILGEEAATALMKAATRAPVLSSVLLPRGVVAWLESNSQGYEGNVPGVPEVYLSLHKGEAGFQGYIQLTKGEVYPFQNQDLIHVAASVSVALDADLQPFDPKLKVGDVQSLGKNIDLLMKTRILQKAEESQESPYGAWCPECKSPQTWTTRNHSPDAPCGCANGHEWPRSKSIYKKDLEKLELPGKAAGPQKPLDAVKPVGPQKFRKPPKLPSERIVQVSKAEAELPCSVCGEPQFRDGSFKLCYCLEDLSKHLSCDLASNGYTVTFDPTWADSDIKLFLDIVHGEI